MGLTLAQLRAEVQTHSGRTDRDATIDRSINMALTTFTQTWLWRQQRARSTGTLAANDLTYDLPTDLARVHRIILTVNATTQYLVMDIRDKGWFIERFANTTNFGTGRPGVGYIEGTTLYFAPKCNQAYNVEVHYVKSAATLVNDTDLSILPNLDEAVIAYAVARIFRSVEQFESANQWLANATQLYSIAKDADQRDPGVNWIAEQTGAPAPGYVTDPWLDPFVKRTN